MTIPRIRLPAALSAALVVLALVIGCTSGSTSSPTRRHRRRAVPRQRVNATPVATHGYAA